MNYILNKIIFVTVPLYSTIIITQQIAHLLISNALMGCALILPMFVMATMTVGTIQMKLIAVSVIMILIF